jgi:hypothetical protein
MLWLVVGIIVTVVIAAALMMKRDDPFQIAADDLGLKLTRTVPELMPKLDGLVDGIAVKVDIAVQRDPVVRYRIFYPALGMALRLERETTISRTLGQLGSGDSEIGAKQFDDSFRINTSRPDALQAMMTPQLRRLLIDLIDKYPGLIITDGDMTLRGATMTPPAETLIQTVRDLVAAAAALIAVRPPALEVPETRPPVPPQPVAPIAADRERMPADERSDPVAKVERSESSLAPPPAEPPPPSPPPPPPAPAAPASGLPDGFFEDVFGANRMSYEDDDRFEAEVRGSTVYLSGNVKQSAKYRDRDDLSPASGTKAVVTVAQIETDLYGKSDIDATVYLGGAADFDRGDEISFSGTIDAVDGFMRNITISDATVKP